MGAFVFSLRLVTALIAGLSLPIALAILIGHAQALPDLGLSSPAMPCSQPCWHMIQPGISDPIDAWHTLETDQTLRNLVRNDPNPIFHCMLTWSLDVSRTPDPAVTGCMVVFPGQPISAIELRSAADTIQLGDLFTYYGQPIAAQLCQRLDLGQRYYDAIFALLQFPNQVTVLAYNADPGDWFVKPTMRVKLIHYDHVSVLSPQALMNNYWQGFAGVSAYGTSCDF